MKDKTQREARDHILRAMKVTGLTSTQLARAAGIAPSTLNRYVNQEVKHTLSLTTLAKVDEIVHRHINSIPDAQESIRLSLLYGGGGIEARPSDMITIQVRGAVQAGYWAEAMEWPVDDWQTVTLPRPDGHASYFGLRVRGPSMNVVYPEGTILVCVPMDDYDMELETDDHVIVQRWHAGMVEATVKELRFAEDGRAWLWPRSTHPEHQAPFALPVNGRDHPGYEGNDEIRVIAVVVADYRVRKPRQD